VLRFFQSKLFENFYWLNLAFSRLLRWLTQQAHWKTQHLSVETSFQQAESGKVYTRFKFLPSPGDHFIWYKNRWLKIERSRESQAVNLNTGIPFETVTLTTFGQDRQFFVNMLDTGIYRHL
jgi:chaperone BCS1